MSGRQGVSVQLERCGKTFEDGTRALQPLSLQIARGETVVFLGPSGCGKTTTLRIIAGLEKPDIGGRVLFNDDDVTDVPIEKRNVGMVFQSYALFPNMNVADNIGYSLKLRGVPVRQRAERIAELVDLTGIHGLETRAIDQLSGGQRQRVALARAVAARPRVLLLDEPLTALDASLRERLRGELDRLLRSLHITAVYVTHDQAEAMTLGDRIVVMNKGEIAQIGAPRAIYFEPANRFVAEFVGAANIVEGDARQGVIVVPGGALRIDDIAVDGPVLAMIRPETIAIMSPDGADLKGRVETVSFTGDRQRLSIVGVAERPLIVDAPNHVVAKPGDIVGLHIPSAAIRLLPKDT